MYYSSSFPKSRILEIDKAILQLRVDHEIQDLINEKNPAPKCLADLRSIGPSVVFWLLLPIFLPAMFSIVTAVVVASLLRRRQRAFAGGEILPRREQLAVDDASFVSL